MPSVAELAAAIATANANLATLVQQQAEVTEREAQEAKEAKEAKEVKEAKEAAIGSFLE